VTTFRRFLVIQALLIWQGGFLFYASVVVTIGTEIHGAFHQGRVTRHVTDALNVIGVAALAILAWDQLRSKGPKWCRQSRWVLWFLMALALGILAWLHPRIESYIDFESEGSISDYAAFYLWHRVYLYVSTVQSVAGAVYVVMILRAWFSPSPLRGGGRGEGSNARDSVGLDPSP
jgi:hypothetical protein